MTIEKPSSAEDEYFAKLEFERKKKAADATSGKDNNAMPRHFANPRSIQFTRIGFFAVAETHSIRRWKYPPDVDLKDRLST